MCDGSTGGKAHQTKHIYYLEIWVGAQGEVIAIASNGHESWELQGRAMGHNMLHCVHRLLWRQAMFTYHKHSYDILLVSHCLWRGWNKGERTEEADTDSVLHWCWSAPWSLAFVCRLLWSAAMSCWPCQLVSPSPRSQQGTGLALLGMPT